MYEEFFFKRILQEMLKLLVYILQKHYKVPKNNNTKNHVKNIAYKLHRPLEKRINTVQITAAKYVSNCEQ